MRQEWGDRAFTEAELLEMDARFSRALVKAGKRGKENIVVGVVTAPGTVKPIQVIPLVLHSGCSSSAGWLRYQPTKADWLPG